MTMSAFDMSRLFEAGLPTTRYETGAKIFVADDPGSTLFLVRSGKVKIISAGIVLETLGENGIFGEMAVIDGEPRSANAVAAEPTEVAAVDRRAFLSLIREHPDFGLEVMRLLARRLRRATESI
jgi:CRP-like cAMP-binding protein